MEQESSRRQVVVIDDEQGVLDVLRDLLQSEGFAVQCFDRPEQVDTLQPEHAPCVFLIDIMLPGTTGIALAQTLRASDFATVPMIAMSASSSWVTAARSTGLFQAVLSKPFELDRVLETIERYAV